MKRIVDKVSGMVQFVVSGEKTQFISKKLSKPIRNAQISIGC